LKGEVTMRIIGIDLGKTSFKAVWLEKQNSQWQIRETFWKVHQQEIEKIWQELKIKWQIEEGDQIVTTGRLRKMLPYPSIVEKIAQEEAARFLYPGQDLTVIRLGGGGFSVLNIKSSGLSKYLQNPRCAAGVGSFLDQIMARVGLNVVQADKLAKDSKGLEITKRCGVTMKTDFTHLLNTGHQLEEVVAGLLDSSAKSAVELALKSEISSQVLIIGGLSVLERIVSTIREKLPPEVTVEAPPYSLYFEALGAALVGKKMMEEKDFSLPQTKTQESPLNFLPALKDSLSSVTKIGKPRHKKSSSVSSLIMGLDIGSTGSKLVIFDQVPVFEAYTETQGQPVEAAKDLVRRVPQRLRKQIKVVGCTGSGRDIVSNLLKASLPKRCHQRIFVLNEIAAHAAGAHYYDEEVDTVVDIGGQDAKFTRLESGRVIDSCMNTVCSAGTGSFLAEQLQLLGIKDVRELGQIALESPRAVNLGQHCAVFISEQIDEARRKGANLPEIVAGLYYSIVQNYNNRVRGLRDYGKKIFLQGKPAENLALACALSQVTGNPIIVPPSPGSPGALGIAILAKKEIGRNLARKLSLDLKPFLGSQILEKKEFRCQSKDGCLVGNLCPIQVITVKAGLKEKKFFWGGACDKYEKRTEQETVLAQAPRPFMEREDLIQGLLNKELDESTETVGIPRGLETEEILPLAITFFQELKFGVRLRDQASLNLKCVEEGAKLCQATFCAPLQLLAGQAKLQEDCDFIFLPKIIEIAGLVESPESKRCYVCPLSQAMPDLFSPKLSTKVLQPLLNFNKGYNGYDENRKEFLKLGFELGCSNKVTSLAYKKAFAKQKEFEDNCRRIGKRALNFAKDHQLPAIVVLGHPYIICSSLLSAGIPEAIQENGAIAIPANCYPLENRVSSLQNQNMYWGYGQRLLQAAFEIRRQS